MRENMNKNKKYTTVKGKVYYTALLVDRMIFLVSLKYRLFMKINNILQYLKVLSIFYYFS